jgi:hypothetical protein
MGRRTTAELKKFYRGIVHSDAPLADRMRAASRLQKLYDAEAPAAPVPVTRQQALDAIKAVTGTGKEKA